MKLFDKVKCKGFYSKVHDGTFIYLDTQNLKASHMNSNATDTECRYTSCGRNPQNIRQPMLHSFAELEGTEYCQKGEKTCRN